MNYRLGAADGNMIASPYIAEMPTGESYKVDSPSIEGFVLEDEEQATVSGNDDKGDRVNCQVLRGSGPLGSGPFCVLASFSLVLLAGRSQK